MARSLEMATRGKQEDPTDQTLYYLAGVVDSDGCIAISKCKTGTQRITNPRYVLTLNVVNMSEVLMVWLVSKFGGRYKKRRLASDKHKATYDWFFNNGKALWLLRLLESRLVVKGDSSAARNRASGKVGDAAGHGRDHEARGGCAS